MYLNGFEFRQCWKQCNSRQQRLLLRIPRHTRIPINHNSNTIHVSHTNRNNSIKEKKPKLNFPKFFRSLSYSLCSSLFYERHAYEFAFIHFKPWKYAGVDLHSKFRFELHNFLIQPLESFDTSNFRFASSAHLTNFSSMST